MSIRISKLSSFAGGAKEYKNCLLIYGSETNHYLLYDTDDTLLWKSDAIPEAAYEPGTRREALREIAEEEIMYDTGTEIILPQYYSGLTPAQKSTTVDTDPAALAKKYPEIVWLANQEIQEIGEDK
jgi:hypothetical protein